VAAVDGGPQSDVVLSAGRRIADIVRLPLTALYVAPPDEAELPAAIQRCMGTDSEVWELPTQEGASPIGVLSRRTDQPGVFAEVLGRGRTAYTVAQRAAAPVVIVPPKVLTVTPIARIAIAIDGSQQLLGPAVRTLRRFVGAGVDVVAVHVFEPGSVPPFWDQPHHALEAWSDEFAARAGGAPTEIITRSGRPREHLLEAALASEADLIVLPWDQRIDPDRASLVRECLAESPIPIMVVPGA
jgi:nucleotide-binding universal stress UspA family protein